MKSIDLETIDLPGYHEVLYYQALLSGIDDVVVSTDTSFVIQTWNAAAEKLYKITAAEAIGRTTSEVLPYTYINTTPEEVIRKVSKENKWKGVVKVTLENNVIYLQSTLTSVKDTSGNKIGYIGVSRNITDEINTKKSLQSFVSVLTQLEESFLIVDNDYKIAFMRPKGNVQKFFDSDYKVGDDAFKYIPDVYYAEVRNAYELAFNGETVNYDAVSEGEQKLYFNVTYTPLKDDYGNVISVCVIVKDFTAQKEMEVLHAKKALVERNLFESRKLFEEFMQNSPLSAWVTDADGYLQYVNPPYLKSFGFTDEIIGTNIRDLYSRELAEEYRNNDKKVIEAGNIIETIEKGNAPDNNIYKVIKFPLQYNGSTMIAGWAVDVSAQIKALETLSLLNEHKNKLVSLIAHDLRGPIGINVSFLKAMIDDYNSYSKEELFTSLRMITKSTVTCYELVDELLLWAKSQLGGTAYEPVAISVQTEILKMLDSLWEQSNQKNIRFKTEFNYNGNVFADRYMIRIILRNFITNAIKFSYEGTEIKIETYLHNNEACISVEDYGTGMNADLVQKLLSKVNHESAFGTKGEKGTGLGLIMAMDYIEKNNGKLIIKSNKGKGSNFSFTLPVGEK